MPYYFFSIATDNIIKMRVKNANSFQTAKVQLHGVA